MEEKQFIEIISALRKQNDKDNNRAKQLSEIYGSDVNPNDNRFLTDVIFDIISSKDQKTKEVIEVFCFEQDYGRQSNRSISDLWKDITGVKPFAHP